MINIALHTSFTSVFHANYDGIYHFVSLVTLPSSSEFKLNGTGPASLFSLEQSVSSTHAQRVTILWMAAGDELYHNGDAVDLYGYRTSDEL